MKLGVYIMAPELVRTVYLQKKIPPVSLCICIGIPLSVPGNGSVNMFPWQQIHATVGLLDLSFSVLYMSYLRRVRVCIPLLLLGKKLVTTFPQQFSIVASVIFCVTHVVSKEGFFFVRKTQCICNL
jgi:hypothetical protein